MFAADDSDANLSSIHKNIVTMRVGSKVSLNHFFSMYEDIIYEYGMALSIVTFVSQKGSKIRVENHEICSTNKIRLL